MKDKKLPEKLIYLDSEFISNLYEAEFDCSPQTQITRSESMQASASIAFFSGGGNSSESRTYGVSSLEMLDKLKERVSKYPDFSSLNYTMDSPSSHCWVKGVLSISKITVTRSTHTAALIGRPITPASDKKDEPIGEEAFFSLKSGEHKFALSPTDHYFTSGIASLKGLAHLVIDRLSIPSIALVRVFSANTAFGEWIATPLVIYDADL